MKVKSNTEGRTAEILGDSPAQGYLTDALFVRRRDEAGSDVGLRKGKNCPA